MPRDHAVVMNVCREQICGLHNDMTIQIPFKLMEKKTYDDLCNLMFPRRRLPTLTSFATTPWRWALITKHKQTLIKTLYTAATPGALSPAASFIDVKADRRGGEYLDLKLKVQAMNPDEQKSHTW